MRSIAIRRMSSVFKETVELVKKSTQENGINSVNTKAIDSSIDNANVMMKEKFHS